MAGDEVKILRGVLEDIEGDRGYLPNATSNFAENIVAGLSLWGMGIAPLPYTVEGGKEQRKIIDAERQRIETAVRADLHIYYDEVADIDCVERAAVLKIVRGER